MGEILDGAFQLYRNHFGTFLGIAAGITIPATLAVTLITWSVTGDFAPMPKGDPMARAGAVILVALLSVPITFAVHILEQSILTIVIADVYLGRPASISSAVKRTLSVIGPLIGTMILTGVAVGFASLFFLVPGILLLLMWLFSTQAVILEGCGVSAALSRSTALTRGRRGQLFLLVLIMTVIAMAVSFGASALVPLSVRTVPVLGTLLIQAPAILVAPLYPGMVTLAYFDARVRSEAFDLEVLSRDAGATPP